MIKRKADMPVVFNENMRGGKGIVQKLEFLSSEDAYNTGRLFGRITINPGCSIGGHSHEKEFEAFYILSGKAKVNDNGEDYILEPGDSHMCKDGDSHSVECAGDEPLEMIALIISI